MKTPLAVAATLVTSSAFACNGYLGYSGTCGSCIPAPVYCCPQTLCSPPVACETQSSCSDCSPVEKSYSDDPVRSENKQENTLPPPPEPILPEPVDPDSQTSVKTPGRLTAMQHANQIPMSTDWRPKQYAKIILHVPEKTAVSINGNRTTSIGKTREYEVLLVKGLSYEFKILAKLGLKEATRIVRLQAGEIKDVR